MQEQLTFFRYPEGWANYDEEQLPVEVSEEMDQLAGGLCDDGGNTADVTIVFDGTILSEPENRFQDIRLEVEEINIAFEHDASSIKQVQPFSQLWYWIEEEYHETLAEKLHLNRI